MMKCLSYKSHQKCPPVTTIGGIYVVDLWISVPETCSNMQKSCLLLRSQHVTVLSKSCESCKWASINYVTLGGNESIDSTDTHLMWKNIYLTLLEMGKKAKRTFYNVGQFWGDFLEKHFWTKMSFFE